MLFDQSYQFFYNFSAYVSNFLVCGNNYKAIAHSVYLSSRLNKYFWRELLEGCDAEVSKQYVKSASIIQLY